VEEKIQAANTRSDDNAMTSNYEEEQNCFPQSVTFFDLKHELHILAIGFLL